MPILDRESDCFPRYLLDDSEMSASRKWYAVYTLARREKELMRRLRVLGVRHYCPLIAKRNRSPGGRIRVAHVPLFASYVFLHAEPSERTLALSTNCISRWLDVTEPELLLADLRQVQRLIESGVLLVPEARLESGMRVRIRSGPLAGIEGAVLRREKESRLLVSVDFLQQGASLLLDDCQVEALDSVPTDAKMSSVGIGHPTGERRRNERGASQRKRMELETR